MKALAIGLLCAGLALIGLCPPAAAADEPSIKAVAAWTARGVTFQTGPHAATFVGALAGPIFVETEKGLVHSAQMMCPAMVEIGLDDGKEHGQGRCTFTATDGAVVYAELNCTGVYMVGCSGTLKLIGGTDRFAGITGSGKAVIRSDLQKFVAVADKAAAAEGTGSMFISALKYTLPAGDAKADAKPAAKP
jgi:hypothetical protein